jgi:hypothetical protein
VSKPEISEDQLASIRERFRGDRKPETLQDRGAKERKARLKYDGRANRSRQTTVRFTTDLAPETKARMVLLCRRMDMRIKDFVEECLEAGLAKHGDDG